MKTILLLIMVMYVSNVTACPDIEGTWVSSKELSMRYNNGADLTEVQIQLLNQILGILKFTYTDSEVREHGHDPIKVVLNNERFDFHFDDLRYEYKMISCTENSVTIKANHPHTGLTDTTLIFINDNTYWLSPDALPKSREYFSRQAN